MPTDPSNCVHQGYIDLSKRRVSPEDVAKCEDRYNKAKAVHSVLRHVADLRGLVLEDLSTKVSWPLYRKYGHAFDAFKLTLQDEEDVFVGLDIDEETKEVSSTKSLNCDVCSIVDLPSPLQNVSHTKSSRVCTRDRNDHAETET